MSEFKALVSGSRPSGNYLIAGKFISIRDRNGKFTQIHQTHALYETLVQFLPRASEFVDLKNASIKDLMRESVIYKYGSELPQTLSELVIFDYESMVKMLKRLQELKAAGIPFEPLLAFFSRLSLNQSTAANLDLSCLVNVVGTTALPVTWDGKAVAYYRGKQNPTVAKLKAAPDWLPGTQNFHQGDDKLFVCESLGGVMSMCSDLGNLHEATIDPANIYLAEAQLGGGIRLGVSDMVVLGEVAEHYLDYGRGGTGYVQIEQSIDEWSNGASVSIRRPLDASSAISATEQLGAYSAPGLVENVRFSLNNAMSC